MVAVRLFFNSKHGTQKKWSPNRQDNSHLVHFRALVVYFKQNRDK